MKQWMKYFVPAAMAGGLLAGNAFADPRSPLRHDGAAESEVAAPRNTQDQPVATTAATDAKSKAQGPAMVARAGKPIQTHASTRASAQEHLAVMREAVTDRRIHAQTQAQMAAMGQEGGNSSADQGSSSASGSAGQRAATAHGPKSAQAMLADTKASLVNTKIHIQTQHEQAAFGYDGANARGDNDADRNDSKASHSSEGSNANQGVVVARGGGDVAGDNFEGGSSAAPVSTAHGSAPQRAGMPSPNALNAPARMHLNANQAQQLTSSRPSEEMGNDREVGSHVGTASSSGSFRAETTSFRAPEPRQASFVREHADHFKMPASRYH